MRISLLFLLLLPSAFACQTAIVGAGIGGLYTAFRLTSARPGESICIYEARSRPGGRILTVNDPLPGFENYTIDIGAYRFNRAHHRLLRLLTEDVLGIETACYTDGLGIQQVCPKVVDRILVSRGEVLGSANGVPVEELLKNETIPYKIGNKLRDAQRNVDVSRSLQVLIGTESVVPEIRERIVELFVEPDYNRAMQIVDEILEKMRTGTYRGVPYADVSLIQVLIAEGFSNEELQLVFDQVFAGNFAGRWSMMFLARLLLREIALEKDLGDGSVDVTPVKEGRRIGMGSIIQALLEEVTKRGVRVYFNKPVARIKKRGSKLRLFFKEGGKVDATEVVLNMGKNELLALGVDSEPLKSGSEEFLRAVERNLVLGLGKMYCFWEDAWWLTKLGIQYGRAKVATGRLGFIRYHDGHVQCEDKQNLKGCRGGLLVSFEMGDSAGIASGTWMNGYNAERYTALTLRDNVRRLSPGMGGIEEMLLRDALGEVWNVHKKELKDLGLGRDIVDAASGCLFGDWRDVGVHVESGPGGGKQEIFVKPVEGVKLVLVNEAWTGVQQWSEGSLISAERALLHAFGVEKPDWVDDTFYDAVIRRFNRGV